MFRLWLNALARRLFIFRRRRGRRPFLLIPSRLRVEEFEPRVVPAGMIFLTVTNTSDSDPGSLRDVLSQLNPTKINIISFNIPISGNNYDSGTGTFTISPLSPLPTVAGTVILDATTEAAFLGRTYTRPIVQLDGSDETGGGDGLVLAGQNSTVKGFIVSNFSGNGINVLGSSGDTISGNWIGIDPTGEVAAGNGGVGLQIQDSINTRVGSTGVGVFPSSLQSGLNGSGHPVLSVTADFNSDGLPDIVTFLSDGSVQTLLGRFGGGFDGPFDDGTLPFGAPASATVGDFDGNNLDIALTASSTNEVTILLGNGDGTFQSPASFADTSPGGSIVTGLFDRDDSGPGHLDLAVSGQGGSITLFQGNGDGTFQTPGSSVGSGTGALATADFNSDGFPDLAVLNGSQLLVYNGQGHGLFSSATVYNVPTPNPTSLVVGDLNGDGFSDLVTGDATNGKLAVILNDGDGNFLAPTLLNGGPDVRSVAVGDFNGDGQQDIATLNTPENTITLLEGTGTGKFLQPFTAATASGSPADLATSDINGDGVADLVVPGAYNTIGPGLTVFQGSSADYLARNVISGNTGGGVALVVASDTVSGNVVTGNYIGTDVTGLQVLPNTGVGVTISSNVGGPNNTTIFPAQNNTVGGTVPGTGNIISGNNSAGITILGAGATGNLAEGNYIGLDVTGSSVLPNVSYGGGIDIYGGASDNTIGGTNPGARNIITGNLDNFGVGGGVEISGSTQVGPTTYVTGNNLVEGNYIGTDATGTAAPNSNTAYTFSGGEGVVLANIPQLNTAAEAQNTVSFWMLWDGGEFEVPFSSGIQGLLFNDGFFGFTTSLNDVYGISSAGLAGDWHYVTAVFTNGDVTQNQLWIDGQEQSLTQEEGSPTPRNIDNNVFIGDWLSDNTAHFTGNLDEVAFFNSALTPDQIHNLYNAFPGTILADNPAAYYRFNETSGFTAFDSSPNGNNAQILPNVIQGVVGAPMPVPDSSGVALFGGTTGNTVGGTSAGAGNLISGSGNDGVSIGDAGTSGNLVEGNLVGLDANGRGFIPGTVSWYQAEGNAFDAVGSRNGILNGGVNFTAGEVGQAFNFDGSSGYITAAPFDYNPDDLNNLTGSFTIDAWINPASLGSDQSIISEIGQDSSGNQEVGGFRLILLSDGTLEFFRISDTVGDYSGLVTTTAISPNTWTHVAVVKSFGESFQIFINGVQADVSNINDTYTSSQPLETVIGADDTATTDFFNGGIDELSIYSTNLFPAQIADIYAAGSAGKAQNVSNRGDGVLIGGNADGNMIGGSTTAARNVISGNGHDGIDVNGQATANTIVGNYVGTDPNGQHVAPNGNDGILLAADNNTVSGNVASGNGGDNVQIIGSNDQVIGNLIGPAADGTTALPTTASANVEIDGGTNNTIGGFTPADRNVISGAFTGVFIGNGSGNLVAGNYIGTDITGNNAIPNGNPFQPFEAGIVLSGSSNNTITVNVVSGNKGYGISLPLSATGNLLTGNIIGLTADGSTPLLNGTGGLAILEGSNTNTVGGTNPGDGNVISGNGGFGLKLDEVSGNLIQGNRIGTDAAGMTNTDVFGDSLANDGDGVEVDPFTSDNTIGGTSSIDAGTGFLSGAGNVISDNNGAGVTIQSAGSTGNIVQGNFLGTDVTGKVALPNQQGGLLIVGAANNTVGGSDPGTGNLISGNNFVGLAVTDGGALSGTVAWFPADFDTNDVIADRNAIPQGNLQFTTGITGQGGDGAFQLDGSSATLDVPDDPALEPAHVSIDAWVQSTNPGNHAYIIAKGGPDSGTGASYGLATDGDGGLEFFVNSGSLVADYTPGVWDGQWHHVVGIFDGFNVTLYVDGLAVALASSHTPVTIDYNLPFSDLYIGSDNGRSGTFFNGNIDSVGIYNRALTGLEVRMLLQSDGQSKAGGNAFEGNLIGTDVSGTHPLPNNGDGILLQVGAINNTIGGRAGTATAIIAPGVGAVTGLPGSYPGNLISGNQGNGINIDPPLATALPALFNVVEGNFIGTDVSGTQSVANGTAPNATWAGVIIDGDTFNTIGGTSHGAGNVISGNLNPDNPFVYGVMVSDGAHDNVVTGNYIGPDASGFVALGNQRSGVYISDSSDNTIGASDSSEGNVISGNGEAGVLIRQQFGSATSASGNVVEGNLIGTDRSGESALPPTFFDDQTSSGGFGVVIDGAADNAIGGQVNYQSSFGPNGFTYLRIGNGNVISGNPGAGVDISDYFQTRNATGNVVEGNLIGTDAGGEQALGNGSWGVALDNTADNTIGGDSFPFYSAPFLGSFYGAVNVISGNQQGGVYVIGSNGTGNLIAGNYIGTDESGQSALGNALSGVYVGDAAGFFVSNQNGPITGSASGNTIGGAEDTIGSSQVPGRNVISGNGLDGVEISGAGASANLVEGNYVGTDSNGSYALPNQLFGVGIHQGASDNTIGSQTLANGDGVPGAANVISGNDGAGIRLTDPGTTGNIVAGNLVGLSGDGNSIVGNSNGGMLIQNGSQGNLVGGSGLGVFPNSQSITWSATPLFEVAGDFNNDGNQDIVAFLSDGTVMTGLGNGDGTFQAPFLAATLPGVPVSAAAGDFNGDGILDLAVTFQNSSDVEVLLGNAGTNNLGTGTFSPLATYSANSQGGQVIAGIFGSTESHASLDLVVSGSGGSLSIFVSNGDGTFSSGGALNVPNGASAGALVAADFDFDGNRDIAVLVGSNVLIYTGDSFGGFSSDPVTVATDLPNPTSLALINLPNHPNTLVVGDSSNGQVALLDNNSQFEAIAFQLPTFLNGGPDVESLAIGDFNGDGLTDIAGLNPDEGSVTLLLGAPGGQFQQPISSAFFDVNQSVIVAGDFNGDGVTDLATPSSGADTIVFQGSNADFLARNVISGNFGSGVTITGSGTSGNVVAGNLIGPDPTGSQAYSGSELIGNEVDGVTIDAGATDNTIGGSLTALRNIISVNQRDGVAVSDNGTTGNLIQGNYIGTDISGQAILGNLVSGVQVLNGASAVTIDRNLISANSTLSPTPPESESGIDIIGPSTSGVLVTGNIIGLTADGEHPLGNVGPGILILNSRDNTIGGTSAAERNVISANVSNGGNAGDGIDVSGTGSTGNLIQGNYVGTDIQGEGFQPGTVSWYRAEGNPNDALGNDNGTVVGNVDYASGQVGQAFQFSGAEGYVALSGPTVLQGARTVEAWILPLDNTDFGLPIFTAGVAGAGDLFGIASSGGNIGNGIAGPYDLYIDHWGSLEYFSTIAVTPDAWNYVAFTFDGSTINFYVNGQAAGSVPGSLYDYGLATADIGGNTIGGTTTKGFFNGNIDELTIYNRALTPAEIATIYAEGSAGKPVFGNAGDGVRIEAGAAKNTVGGFTAGAGNVISGNVADGIGLTDSGTSVNVIAGNIIGLNAAGNAVAPNGGSGVNIFAGAANNYIGYSPNSIFVASYNSDTVQQYDSNTGRSDGAFVSLGSGGLVNPVDPIIGPDGNLYVSSKTDGNVLRFDGRTGAFLEVFVTSGPASAAIAPDGITFGPDGDLYVVDDISGNVLRYDGTTGAFLGVFAVGSPGAGGDLVFGTNGHLYVDSNSNNLIEEFDSTGAFVRSLGSGTNLTNPTGLAFGPDGLLYVASSGNDEILRFNATTGAFVDTFAAGEALDYPIGLEFGPDGNLYASNGNIDTVVRYDATGNFLGTVVVTGSGGLDGAQYFTFANAYAANVISGNLGYGVSISDAATSGNIVAGNDIGTCPNGTTASGISNTPLGNRLSGVLLLNSTHDNLIGSDGANPNGTFMGNVISGNRADGVDVIAGANHNIVAGNSIGTTISGGEGLGNAGFGVGLFDQTTDNTVGGTVPAQRNVISANEFGVAIIGSGGPVSGNLVIGNYIGTDATGEAPVGNNIAGVAISQGATDNSIGGSAAGERNVISGNTNFDVAIINTGTTGNVVAGNLIGTDVTGTSSLSAGSQNNLVGIFLGASGNTLGGPAAADRNVISGAPIFSGVAVSDGAHDNTVEGNYIGTDVSGTSAIPNVVGIDVFNSETASPDNHTVNNLIQGNLISGNTADGVRIEQMNTTGNQVLDNRIGSTFDGSAALANGGNGVVIDLGATNNVIGAGNLISGNGTNGIDITDSATTGNIVVGNFIGPDVTGSTHLANQGVGVLITNSSANTVGGTTAAARNIVSGNHTEGVSIVGTQAVGNVVEGNYIGTDATGTQSVPNGSEGVSVGDARETIIGGLTPGARNIISGGGRDGIGIGGVFEVGTQVLGNWIGLDVNGNTLHNALTGVYVNFGRDNLIAGNVISGNHASGIQLDNRASGNVIQANFIGTDPTGTTNVDHLGHTLGNSADGVLIDNQSTANTVGGATAGGIL